VIVGLLYALKWLRHPAEARAERKHPVKMNFVPTLSIGILLVAGAWLPSSPAAALPLWTLGALLHLELHAGHHERLDPP
jgi:tellurite resistance protein